MLKTTYVPILKGKRNDLQALAGVPAKQREGMKPIVDLPASADPNTPHSVTNCVDSLVKMIGLYVPHAQEIFVDLYRLNDYDEYSPGIPAMVGCLNALLTIGRRVTPVVGLERPLEIVEQVRDVALAHGKGACLRIDAETLAGQADEVANKAREYANCIGADADICDLVLVS